LNSIRCENVPALDVNVGADTRVCVDADRQGIGTRNTRDVKGCDVGGRCSPENGRLDGVRCKNVPALDVNVRTDTRVCVDADRQGIGTRNTRDVKGCDVRGRCGL
jgi:hypothetical protein